MGEVVRLPVLQASREQMRSRRRREVRKRTINCRRMTKSGTAFARTYADAVMRVIGAERPKTRAECVGGERPCPWVSCRHHLYLDVNDRGGLILNFPDIEDDEARDMGELKDTCALDVADRGGETLEGVGERMNFTRERTRQVEVMAAAKIADDGGLARFRGHETGEGLSATIDHAWAESGGGAYSYVELRYGAEGLARGVWDLSQDETAERLATAQSRAYETYERRLVDRGFVSMKRHPLADERLAQAEEVIAARAAERNETTMAAKLTEEQRTERNEMIFSFLKDRGPSAPVDVAEALGVKANVAGKSLRDLAAQKLIATNGRGGKACRYFMPGDEARATPEPPPLPKKPRAPRVKVGTVAGVRRDGTIAVQIGGPLMLADVAKKHASPRFIVRVEGIEVDCADATAVLELARASRAS